jgi:cellulose synthase/poly-beta-1,6-N-acetylglucosamine synthase-like glycosyltransferase
MRRIARVVVGPLFVAVLLAAGLLSLAPDLVGPGSPWSLLLSPLDTVVLLAVLVSGLGLAVVVYAALLRREDPGALVHEGRPVEAIVPVYRDADVMHRAVEALLDAEYEPLAVTLVVEPDDPASRERAHELAEHDAVSVLVNEANPGSKAGALNAAIEAGDAPVVALFDADQRPHAKLIPHAVAALADADIARVRSLPDPSEGVLESMVYYEYLFLYFLPQKLVKVVLGMAFAGTRSVLIERSVFDAVGTFEPDHLAEDLDFTHRINRAGVDIEELLYFPTLEAPAHTWRDWWGQRLRWMRGQVDVSASFLVEPRELLTRSGLASGITLVGTLVAGVLLTLTLPKLLVTGLDRPVAVGVGLLGIYGVALSTRAIDDRSAGLSGVGLGWLLLPLAFTLFGVVIVRVVLGFSLGLEGEWYSVEK